MGFDKYLGPESPQAFGLSGAQYQIGRVMSTPRRDDADTLGWVP